MKFNSRQLKGLTMVELLVVLSVIVILSGVTISVVNPQRQRQRSQDAALTNTIGGLAEAIEAFHNINGVYPTSSAADQTEMQRFVSAGFTVGRAGSPNNYLRFHNPGIFVARVASSASNPIFYWDPRAGGNTLPCLEAASNETTTRRIAWAPGYGVRNISSTCSAATGYAELIL